ncbi:M24 family metallopeptidase [Gemmatimonadota bacterium DH-20]|uniref:M24 family metallopeptidase n=1 Tax=Gaopeijia maritima TaxID=3119007 RepID=A0ABU9E5E6_9BACT
MLRRLLPLVALLAPAAPGAAQPPSRMPADAPARYHPMPPLRVQADQMQEWVAARLDRVLPALMEEYDVDMWILSMREYGEDPVFWSIVSPTTFAARRRSIYLFTRREDGTVERLALGGTSQGGLFETYRSPRPAPTGEQAELWGDEQWRLLNEIVTDRDPSNIVLNIDDTWAFADGLGAGEREALEAALGERYLERVRREPRLATDYIATRVPEMMPRYREVMETVHAIISEAFSNSVITPGETTTEDVVWWLRQKVNDLGMTAWFQPSVSVQRAGDVPTAGEVVIERGDLLWTDFGVVAQRLSTDTQHLGYVLREGETEVPAGLRACMRASNRMQEIQLEEMTPGRTGNEALRAAQRRMAAEGIEGTLYSHPIGDHGHGAGPLIGRWDAQEGVPGRGDAVIRPSTWYSIELQATVPIPEWDGRTASCRQEEEAYLDENGDRHWVLRRQEVFHLVW